MLPHQFVRSRVEQAHDSRPWVHHQQELQRRIVVSARLTARCRLLSPTYWRRIRAEGDQLSQEPTRVRPIDSKRGEGPLRFEPVAEKLRTLAWSVTTLLRSCSIATWSSRARFIAFAALLQVGLELVEGVAEEFRLALVELQLLPGRVNLSLQHLHQPHWHCSRVVAVESPAYLSAVPREEQCQPQGEAVEAHAAYCAPLQLEVLARASFNQSFDETWI